MTTKLFTSTLTNQHGDKASLCIQINNFMKREKIVTNYSEFVITRYIYIYRIIHVTIPKLSVIKYFNPNNSKMQCIKCHLLKLIDQLCSSESLETLHSIEQVCKTDYFHKFMAFLHALSNH